MYKIALICENGASTGLCMKKMINAAERQGIDCEINAYSYAQLSGIAQTSDCLLLGPQVAFKADQFKKQFPEQAAKFTVMNSMDFGMMNGEKILSDAIYFIEHLSK